MPPKGSPANVRLGQCQLGHKWAKGALKGRMPWEGRARESTHHLPFLLSCGVISCGDNEKKPGPLSPRHRMFTLEGKVSTRGDGVSGHAYTGASGCPLGQIPPPTLPASCENREKIGKWLIGQRQRSQAREEAGGGGLEADKDPFDQQYLMRNDHTGLPRRKGFRMNSSGPPREPEPPRH